MPKEMGLAYSGLAYQEKVAPPPGPTFALAILFVFLLLAALYESWRLPWAVLLSTPTVVLGASFGVWVMGLDNNIYVQVGNIMLIGSRAGFEPATFGSRRGATAFLPAGSDRDQP